MAVLKRLPLKYIRDRSKSRYKKDDSCYICGDKDSLLDFHHYNTLDILLTNWLKKKGLTNKIRNADDIIGIRDLFISEHEFEMFEFAVTLCRDCHKRLHSVYGQRPVLSTAEKQKRWVNKQREKRCPEKCGRI